MGSCGISRKTNTIISSVNRPENKNITNNEDNSQIKTKNKDIKNNENVNNNLNEYIDPIYDDLEEYSDEEVGEGIKKMKAFKWNDAYDNLYKLRSEFWTSRKNDKKIWAVLKQACETDNATAISLLESIDLVPIEGCLNRVKDFVNDKEYRIPNYCINDPVIKKVIKPIDPNKIESKKITINIVDMTNPNNKDSISIPSNIYCLDLKKCYMKVKKLSTEDYRIRCFFNGSEIKDDHLLAQHNLINKSNIQFLINKIESEDYKNINENNESKINTSDITENNNVVEVKQDITSKIVLDTVENTEGNNNNNNNYNNNNASIDCEKSKEIKSTKSNAKINNEFSLKNFCEFSSGNNNNNNSKCDIKHNKLNGSNSLSKSNIDLKAVNNEYTDNTNNIFNSINKNNSISQIGKADNISSNNISNLNMNFNNLNANETNSNNNLINNKLINQSCHDLNESKKINESSNSIKEEVEHTSEKDNYNNKSNVRLIEESSPDKINSSIECSSYNQINNNLSTNKIAIDSNNNEISNFESKATDAAKSNQALTIIKEENYNKSKDISSSNINSFREGRNTIESQPVKSKYIIKPDNSYIMNENKINYSYVKLNVNDVTANLEESYNVYNNDNSFIVRNPNNEENKDKINFITNFNKNFEKNVKDKYNSLMENISINNIKSNAKLSVTNVNYKESFNSKLKYSNEEDLIQKNMLIKEDNNELEDNY